MNTQISTKLFALAIALMMNGVILGGVAYLFNAQSGQHVVLSLAQVPATVSAPAA
ncbi:MAG TPA: hypothetical protein VHV81_16870 [Steroidobacteraceae bacterium]|jgi:hypothetical protein|nr:hypothetical protein [Steroidobacteraceae bacterium]